MDKWKAAARSSEFWVGLITTVLAFLVAQGLVPPEAGQLNEESAVYVGGRLVSKLVKFLFREVVTPPAA